MDEAEAAEARKKARAGWTLEVVDSFEEAERRTRAHWHAASSEERFAAAAQLRQMVYGQAATARLQRFLELVPGS